MKPCLYIVIPCYNEEKVLPFTGENFSAKVVQLVDNNAISEESRVLYVNDGSTDNTWNIILQLAEKHKNVKGISLTRNSGHQNALLAGLFEAKSYCDITISIDCDGQDDIDAIDEMVNEYKNGNDIVYGIRSDRKTDSFFKRNSAQLYYKMLNKLGVEVVYNHADYRLLAAKVVEDLEKYDEVNLYLRGIIPKLGYNSGFVYYRRKKRIAGETHYPLKKMMTLAIDGVTSFSIKPLRIIIDLGMIVAFLSFVGVIWTFVSVYAGRTVQGWASMTAIICFLGGIQLISIGVLGEYVGKIYLETKHRPRYNVYKKTYKEESKEQDESKRNDSL